MDEAESVTGAGNFLRGVAISPFPDCKMGETDKNRATENTRCLVRMVGFFKGLL